MGKVNKAIDPIQNFEHAVSRLFLVIIYNAFTRPHLDYGDLFDERIESVQYQLSNKKIDPNIRDSTSYPIYIKNEFLKL